MKNYHCVRTRPIFQDPAGSGLFPFVILIVTAILLKGVIYWGILLMNESNHFVIFSRVKRNIQKNRKMNQRQKIQFTIHIQ